MPATLQSTPLYCRKCKHEWWEPIVLNVAVDVWIVFIKHLRCPKCDATYRKISFDTRPARMHEQR